MIKRFIEHCGWFHKTSQDFVLASGWDNAKFKARKDFVIGYPRAFIVFMWLSRRDILKQPDVQKKGLSDE